MAITPIERVRLKTKDVLVRRLRLPGWTDADWDKIIEVDPAQIVHYQDVRYLVHRRVTRYEPDKGISAREFAMANRGKVLDGSWDLVRTRFDRNDIHRLLHEHYVEGVPWQETEVFKTFAYEIEAGERRWRWSSSREELLQAAEETDQLFEAIRRDGYRRTSSPGATGVVDEVTVSIGRDGELLYNNLGGHHRLSIAKILGIERVPVRVLLRHSEWQEKREAVRRGDVERLGDGVLGHPDLEDLLR